MYGIYLSNQHYSSLPLTFFACANNGLGLNGNGLTKNRDINLVHKNGTNTRLEVKREADFGGR